MNQNKYLLSGKSRKKLMELISNHKDTRKVNLSEEYPKIKSYLENKFNNINIEHVPIYVVNNDYISRKGFKYCGGFFLKDPESIVVKQFPGKLSSNKKKSKINHILSESMGKSTLEDVILHECIHAVSSTMKRYSRVKTHMEEVFVYTNSVDYYTSNNQETVDSVIGRVFLPFLVNDIISSRKSMKKIVLSLELDDNELKKYFSIINSKRANRETIKEYDIFMDKYAEIIVPEIIKNAKENGRDMVKKYVTLNSSSSVSVASDRKRMLRLRSNSLIEFD